jgi:Leucine-rich repeat (LRR) protein/spore coat protein CotH
MELNIMKKKYLMIVLLNIFFLLVSCSLSYPTSLTTDAPSTVESTDENDTTDQSTTEIPVTVDVTTDALSFVEVTFEDSGLESAIREEINKPDGVIYQSDLNNIFILDLVGLNITSLNGIEYVSNLQKLDLEDNFIDDVSPLASLSQLQWLSLRNNHITDLSEINFETIKDLPLTHLSLRHNVVDLDDDLEIRISDVSVLSNFTQLEFLELRDLQITDISPLSNLTSLEELDISQNPISDTTLSSLSLLVNLTSLNIRETGATDLSVLNQMTELTYLNIHSNGLLESVSFLSHLTKLEELIAENVPIGEGISAIANLTNLRIVNLQNTGLESLDALAQLMSNGALQDQPLMDIEADVNIVSNPLDVEDYRVLDDYWENISTRLPYSLPVDDNPIPIINEFMASNGESIKDYEDANEDWIEIYNPYDTVLDISGYYLSDDPDDLQKWAFPENTLIQAHSYLIVFASGKNTIVEGEIHTNFGISKDGESLILTSDDGLTILDQVPSTEVPRDYSFGRLNDGSSQWVYFNLLNATPGESNNDATPYDDSGAIIPTDFNYNIESFDRIFDDSIAKSITIEISQNEWDDLNQAMIDYDEQFDSYRTSYYAMADFVYEDGNGQVRVENIGFRTRGGSYSRNLIEDEEGNLQMSHFKVSFHETFDEEMYHFNDIRTVFNVEELDMKWNRNYESTYLSEKFALDLMSQFGVYAAHTTLANLYIKIGDTTYFYGVYTIYEPIDNLFLEERMDGEEAEGDLYKSLWQHYGPATLWDDYPYQAIGEKDTTVNYRPTYDIKTNKSTYDRLLLESFIENVSQLNDQAFDDYISRYFDVDRFLRYLAVNALVGNPDDYRSMGNNYYFYHNPVNDMWTIIPYDFDHGMGEGWNPFEDYSLGLDIYEWETLNGIRKPVLSDKILKIERYQLQYEAYLLELMDPENDLFSYDVYYDLFTQQKAIYDDDLENAMLNLNFDIRDVQEYMQSKIQEISDQIEYYQNNPEKRP